jgi:glucose/mannose-6-phosphate isomerase
MEEAIRQFHTQFSWHPVVGNSGRLFQSDKFIVAGMGGSALAAGLLKVHNPYLDLLIHRDYGLPRVPDYFLRESLFIASSYSGNTEETIDACTAALRENLHVAALTTGGALLDLAKANKVPFVQIPASGIQPRMALGYALVGLCALMDSHALYEEVTPLSAALDANRAEGEGKALAEKIRGKIPLIYASAMNAPIAYAWKISFNETGKIPAFCNALPELNHNEMTGFDPVKSEGGNGLPASEKGNTVRAVRNEHFAVIMLQDDRDDPRIQKRMALLQGFYTARGTPVHPLTLQGASTFEKIFSSVLFASWTGFYIAQEYGLEPEQVPMVEEFKKALQH